MISASVGSLLILSVESLMFHRHIKRKDYGSRSEAIGDLHHYFGDLTETLNSIELAT